MNRNRLRRNCQQIDGLYYLEVSRGGGAHHIDTLRPCQAAILQVAILHSGGHTNDVQWRDFLPLLSATNTRFDAPSDRASFMAAGLGASSIATRPATRAPRSAHATATEIEMDPCPLQAGRFNFSNWEVAGSRGAHLPSGTWNHPSNLYLCPVAAGPVPPTIRPALIEGL